MRKCRLPNFLFGFISLIVILGSGCSNTSAVRPLSDSTTSIDPYQEKSDKLNKISNNFHEELKLKGLLYSDKEANQYLNAIGNKVAPKFLKENDGLHFYIIKDPSANAMALPNGNIYINIGLLSVVENEDQLASVLAHEVGHVIHRHSLKGMIKAEDTKLLANIADIFLLGTGLGNASAISNLARFSREQEKEADIVSLDYMHKAGYDLNQVPVVFNIFQMLPETLTTKDSAYSSHPDNKDRVIYVEKIIKDTYPGLKARPVVSDTFNSLRVKVVETNVKTRLMYHQYELALLTLEQAEKYYKKDALIQYYRGEAYRLKADNPLKAAKEMQWLAGYSEEEKKIEKDEDYFIKNKSDYYKKAEQFYHEAMKIKTNLALPYRGLGLIAYSNDKYEKSISNLNTYLRMADSPKDSLYIKRIIRNCERKGN